MKKTYKKVIQSASVLFLMATASLGFSTHAGAADYTIDKTHTFVEFRIQHLGYSWLYGRFNSMDGNFVHDANAPESNRINFEIDTASIDTNHAERDKHLRAKKYLDVKRFPKATFKSTGYSGTDSEGVLTGDLTLYGTTKSININVTKVGEGKDPWGGYRAGFAGTMVLRPSDFGLSYNLGPASTTMEMSFGIEGKRN